MCSIYGIVKIEIIRRNVGEEGWFNLLKLEYDVFLIPGYSEDTLHKYTITLKH